MSFKAVLFFVNLLAAVATLSTASPLEDSLQSETPIEPDAYWALSNWVIKRDEASVAQPQLSDAAVEPDAGYWALSNWVIKREPDAEVAR
ncbi:hypothetical protein C8Q80DRAFT_1274230 [Daedaleopsis nitida]|nr:hypothetical protein C8Q80DRAFT_1274230 [Daedaleopsis nitida]